MTTPRVNHTRISIPADPGHLDVLRLVVRNACARRDCSVDAIDDAALAVHEAGLAFIEAGAERIDMELDDVPGHLDVLLTSGHVELDLESMSFRIIEALTETLEAGTADGNTSLRLRLGLGD
ncbi:MAG TPA: hypothetical protein VK960_06030 [Acidimicrobiia bacterium]|nr:hypothetical protein [Acidimicrobiia bacterium]